VNFTLMSAFGQRLTSEKHIQNQEESMLYTRRNRVKHMLSIWEMEIEMKIEI
jgi:hypothetical protein